VAKLPKLKHLEPVWVKWKDATEDSGTTGSLGSTVKVGGLSEAWDHGWFVSDDGHEFVVARTLYKDGVWTGSLTIPSGWVVKVLRDKCPFGEPKSEAD
jgi:hypothetical protein